MDPGACKKVVGADYDVAKHFTPRYKPLGPAPVLHSTRSVSRDQDGKPRWSPTRSSRSRRRPAIALRESLEADIIVTATGLKVQLMGGMEVWVDGARVALSRAMSYKGMMYR